MRLKYYLRGIGIGVIFATLLLSISFYFGKDNFSSNDLTDEEIIERATELGMILPEDSDNQQEDDEDKNSEVSEDVEEQVVEDAESDADVDDSQDTQEEPATESTETTTTYIPFTVNGGDSSNVVAYNLYKAGLVDSSDDFNKYLVSLGVDNRIQSGTFYVKEGSSYDDIVVLLVNKEHRTTTPPTE